MPEHCCAAVRDATVLIVQAHRTSHKKLMRGVCLCREGHLRKDLLGFDRHWNRYWLLGASFTTGKHCALQWVVVVP